MTFEPQGYFFIISMGSVEGLVVLTAHNHNFVQLPTAKARNSRFAQLKRQEFRCGAVSAAAPHPHSYEPPAVALAVGSPQQPTSRLSHCINPK